jgi:hypothetical protein
MFPFKLPVMHRRIWDYHVDINGSNRSYTSPRGMFGFVFWAYLNKINGNEKWHVLTYLKTHFLDK